MPDGTFHIDGHFGAGCPPKGVRNVAGDEWAGNADALLWPIKLRCRHIHRHAPRGHTDNDVPHTVTSRSIRRISRVNPPRAPSLTYREGCRLQRREPAENRYPKEAASPTRAAVDADSAWRPEKRCVDVKEACRLASQPRIYWVGRHNRESDNCERRQHNPQRSERFLAGSCSGLRR